MNLVDKNLLKAYLKRIHLIFSTPQDKPKPSKSNDFYSSPSQKRPRPINSRLKTTNFSTTLVRLKKGKGFGYTAAPPKVGHRLTWFRKPAQL